MIQVMTTNPQASSSGISPINHISCTQSFKNETLSKMPSMLTFSTWSCTAYVLYNDNLRGSNTYKCYFHVDEQFDPFNFVTVADSTTCGNYDDKVRNEPIHEATQHGETILECSINLAEWMLQHNVKTSAMDDLLKKGISEHMLPYHKHKHFPKSMHRLKQALGVQPVEYFRYHCCPCDRHVYKGDAETTCPKCNKPR